MTMTITQPDSGSATSYFGGKSGAGTYQTIINHIPPHTTYVELFGGKLGIYRHKKPAKETFVFERDTSLRPFYEQLGFWCYDYSYEPDDRIRRNLYRSHALRGVRTVFLGDSIELIQEFIHPELWDRPDVFIYADPPYLMDTRRDPNSTYRHELTNEQHKELLDQLTRFKDASIAISTYPNQLYQDHFWEYEWAKEWDYIKFPYQTRQGKVTQHLWMNYPRPVKLHDYRYLGKNYRERENIARMQERWLLKFMQLPALQQNAMISKLQNAINP